MKTTIRIPYKQFGYIEVELDGVIDKDKAKDIALNVKYSKNLIDIESDGGGSSFKKTSYNRPYTNSYNNAPAIDLNAKFDTTELKVYKNNKIAMSKDGVKLTELQYGLIRRDDLKPWDVNVRNTKYDVPKRLKGSVNTEPFKATVDVDNDKDIPWDIEL